MSKNKRNILEKLARAVIDGNEAESVSASREALKERVDAAEAIVGGLAKGMETVGHYYETQKYFLPEVVVASEAFKAGAEVLKPHVKKKPESPGTIVLGTVFGDTHDIGKNIVAIMFSAAGYEVHDVGRDVPAEVFVNKVRETRADILGLSALMTTSMVNMKSVIKLLAKEGLRDKVKVIVGGSMVNDRFARDIEADAYGPDAVKSLHIAGELIAASRRKAGG